ncbi:MAG: hypothetical protein ABL886_06320 [Rhodoglobus sp.]
MISRTLVTASAVVLLLAGCAAPAPDSVGTDPLPPGSSNDCLIGTWELDVPAYAADSEAYVTGLAVPITDFAMDGAGRFVFTPDGLVAVDISLRTTGTIIAGDTIVPVDVPSIYSATADWSRTGESTVQFDNWAKFTEGDDIPPEVDVPALDYTQLSTVEASCAAGELFLRGPDAPFGASWTRL